MATLFVDCGNTLIIWNRVFNALGEEAWQPNWDVVAAAERWQTQGLGDIVVWSEKSEDDAQRWARRVVPQMQVTALAKDLKRPLPGDVSIDDVTIAVAGVCYRPNQSFLVAPPPAAT